jgi:hypothetical protein
MAMQQLVNNRIGWLRLSMAGLMAGLMLSLTFLAASGSFHRALHHDSSNHHGPCAVCSIHQGKLDAPNVSQPKAVVPVSIAWTLLQSDSQFVRSFDYSLTPSRGPPAFISL